MRTITITWRQLFIGALLAGALAWAASPTIQATPWLFKSNVDVRGVTSLGALDAGVQSKVGGATIGALLAQDGGVATRVCQFGYVALSTGAASVTYTTAFSSLPQCQCTHRNTTNANACVIDIATAAPSATVAKFAVTSGGSDVIDWLCCGDL